MTTITSTAANQTVKPPAPARRAARSAIPTLQPGAWRSLSAPPGRCSSLF
jgi:hypothetical protein